MTRPVYQSDLPSPQEGWVAVTSCQPEAPEPFGSEIQIQNGERNNTEGSGQEEQLDGLDRREGCLPLPIEERGRKYIRFTWEEIVYEFQCLHFGLSSTPRVFTKLLKPGDGPPQTKGDAEHDFLRHADGRIEVRSGMPVTGSPGPPQAAGVHWKKSKLLPTHKLVLQPS